MPDKFAAIDKVLGTQTDIVEVEESVNPIDRITDDLQKDYEYTRANLYSLVEKGQEALNGILEVAGEGGSARAYEVAGQIIKSVADTTDKLVDLQKKVKDMDEDSDKSKAGNVTNNAVFVGSTSELQKLLKQGILNNSNEKN